VKLLCLHADRFAYRFDHPTPGADEHEHEAGEQAAFEEALVVFVAVEPGDEGKINHAAKEVRHLARRANVRRIVVNPFVHLTSEPASPDEAHGDSERLAERLRETFDGEVVYTSFGWYKAFRIDVRGDEASMFFRHV
jgi:threonyl-tRNA synthetase